MTEKQLEWTNRKAKRLDDIISVLYPMKDYEIEAVNLIIDGIVQQDARGNEEVRSKLLDVLEKWEIKLHEDKKSK